MMKTITLKKWAEYLKLIQDVYGENGLWIFRGQSDQNWKLKSNLQRLSTPRIRDIEKELLRKYKSESHLHGDTQSPKDTLSHLAHMQHYGCPTRLLDFTESAYMAAFFAYEDTPKFISFKESDYVAIWIINSNWLKIKTMSKLLNDGEFIEKLKEDKIDYDAFKLQKEAKIEAGLEEEATKFEKRFFDILEQKVIEYFSEFFIRSDHKINIIYPIKPSTLTKRFYNQKGVFLCPSNLDISFTDTLEDYHDNLNNVILVRLPKSERETAFGDFNRTNISRDHLFPGLDGFAQSLINAISNIEY